jgi:transcriptional regulator with XRE-family HTH domain
MADKLLIQFGKILQSKRKALGVSQEDFAEMVGVHRTYIGMLERGEKNVTLKNIARISKALKMPISDLVKGL